MDLEILKPFGPSIIKLKIPSDLISEINSYTDKERKSASFNARIDREAASF